MTLPWETPNARGDHPNFDDETWRQISVEAALRRPTKLRSHPGVFDAVVSFLNEHTPLTTVDDNGEVETWSFEFNNTGLFRFVGLWLDYTATPRAIRLSGSAYWCAVDGSGSFSFFPARETLREFRLSAGCPAAKALETLELARKDAIDVTTADLIPEPIGRHSTSA